MRDVSYKFSTFRTAKASTFVKTTPKTIQVIKDGKVPKGDVLEISKTAALSGVKRCDELIPYCHSVPLDTVLITYEIEDDRVNIETQVKATYKTGVEIEALLAAQLVAINLYDLLKPIEEDIEIGPTQLLEKTGGHGNFESKDNYKAAVLVASDACSKGEREDRSGKALSTRLEEEGFTVTALDILPDEKDQIQAWVLAKADEGIDLIMTTGGTGLSPRDVTVEAVEEIIEREVPGVSEAVRAYGRDRLPLAIWSRGTAGLCKNSLVITLPGSTGGVTDGLNALFPGLHHAFLMRDGKGH